MSSLRTTTKLPNSITNKPRNTATQSTTFGHAMRPKTRSTTENTHYFTAIRPRCITWNTMAAIHQPNLCDLGGSPTSASFPTASKCTGILIAFILADRPAGEGLNTPDPTLASVRTDIGRFRPLRCAVRGTSCYVIYWLNGSVRLVYTYCIHLVCLYPGGCVRDRTAKAIRRNLDRTATRTLPRRCTAPIGLAVIGGNIRLDCHTDIRHMTKTAEAATK